MTYDDGPLRFVAFVVGALAAFLIALLAAVQFGSQSSASVLTAPLVLVVPLVFGAIYYYIRDR